MALTEGSHSSAPACVLSVFTGIPFVRLHNNRDHWNKCDHAGVSLSPSYSDYTRATVQLLETFHWEKVAVLYEGKVVIMSCHVMSCYVIMLCYVMLCYVVSCHVMLCHVILCYVMSCCVMSCHVM